MQRLHAQLAEALHVDCNLQAVQRLSTSARFVAVGKLQEYRFVFTYWRGGSLVFFLTVIQPCLWSEFRKTTGILFGFFTKLPPLPPSCSARPSAKSERGHSGPTPSLQRNSQLQNPVVSRMKGGVVSWAANVCVTRSCGSP